MTAKSGEDAVREAFLRKCSIIFDEYVRDEEMEEGDWIGDIEAAADDVLVYLSVAVNMMDFE